MVNNNSLEQRLYTVNLNNLNDLEALKEEAKSQLGEDSLSHEKRTLILNTIVILNEAIMNTTAAKLPEGELKLLYTNTLNHSVIHLSNVVSQDRENFAQSLEAVNAELDHLSVSDETFRAKQLFEDVMMYGIHVLADSKKHKRSISEFLKRLDPSIEMISTTGDGNCFYNAISTADWMLANKNQKNKHEERHEELRLKTTEYMETQGASESLVAKHAKDRTWAGQTQIQYLVGAENKPILVLSRNPKKDDELFGTIYVKEGSDVDPNELRVIVNENNVHFNALFTTLEAREKLIQKYHSVPVR